MSLLARSKLYIGPPAIAAIVFLAGIMNIFSALIASPWIRLIRRIAPIVVFDASRTLTVVSGILLLVLAQGLWQRKHRAWVFSVALLIISLFSHLIKGGDFIEMIALAVPLILLFIYRWEFTVRSVRSRIVSRIKTFLIVIGLLVLYVVGGFSLLSDQFREPVSVQSVITNYENIATGLGVGTLQPRTARARWFHDSLFTINLILITLAFAGLFSPFIPYQDLSEHELRAIRRLIDEWGVFSVSYFGLLGDKRYYLAPHGQAVVSYGVSNNTAVVLGGPITSPEFTEKTIQDFTTAMKKTGLSTTFYLVPENELGVYEKLGFTLLKIGEEAIIRPADFSLAGSNMKKLRNSVTHAEHSGVIFSSYPLDQVPGQILVETNTLRSEWLGHRTFPELTFSIDFYPFPFENKGYLVTAHDKYGGLLCALSFLPYQRGQGLALDGMFRSDETGINGVVEAAIAKSILIFKDKNIQELSLGLVALAHTQPDPVTASFVQKGRSLLFRHFNQFYNYQTLFAFKQKFQPQWQPRYVAFQGNTELLKVAIAIIGVHTRKTLPLQLLSAAESLFKKKTLVGLTLMLAILGAVLWGTMNSSQVVTFVQHIYYSTQQPTTPTSHTSQIQTFRFYSPSLQQDREATVYLPQEYFQNATAHFPVLYLLHGDPGSDQDWFINAHLQHIVDDLIDHHQLKPLIIVCPDGTGPKVIDSQYVNATRIQQPMATNISEELVTEIDHHYRTLTDRRSRAIGGISSGAYGATNLLLHYPQKYSVVLSISGYYINHEEVISRLFFPNQTTLAENNPLDEIEITTPPTDTYFFLHINDQEDVRWIQEQHRFADALRSKKIPVEESSGKGGHGWTEWQRDSVPALIFLGNHLKF